MIDCISKVLSRDSQNGYAVLTYIDIKTKFTDKKLEEFLEIIIKKFPILKQDIIEKGSNIFLEDDPKFNIKNHYKIFYDTFDKFDSYTDKILNLKFKTKSRWLLRYIIDKDSKKYRIYFKIDHSYADGYKIIEMLMSPIKLTDISTTFKNRNTIMLNTLYYMTIGTVILFFNFFKILIECLFLVNNSKHKQTTHIKCKPFKLSEIKKIIGKNTVNDFVYSLLVRTDYLYTNIKRDIVTCSPINISGSKYFNNMAPIINKISNGMNNGKLLNTVHNTFDSYKYSLYIPIFSFILNNITYILPLNIISYAYDSLIERCDYIFSNIIGPAHESLEDIHFLTIAKNKEIVFNIISSNDNINIICSFKEDVIQDKERFEDCIYKAYDSLFENLNECKHK